MRARHRPSAARLRRTAAGAFALTVATLTGGCGFLSAHAGPVTPPDITADSTATSSGAAASTTAGADPSAAADLAAAGTTGRPASLSVTVAPVTKGVPGLQTSQGLLSAVCRPSAAAAEYATVTVVFTDRGALDKQEPVSSNLRVDLAVVGGSGTGVFERSDAERSSSPAGYCPGTAVLPARTTLQTEELRDEHQTMTVYVVAPTSPATPDPLHGATVQLSNPRLNANSINLRPWTWNVAHVTAGSPCPDDPNSLCVPLS
jgi:hypothetical protein